MGDRSEERKEWQRQYYLENRDKLRKQARDYYYKHRDKYVSYGKKYWAENKEALNLRRKGTGPKPCEEKRLRANLKKENEKAAAEERRKAFLQMSIQQPVAPVPTWTPKNPDDFTVRFE